MAMATKNRHATRSRLPMTLVASRDTSVADLPCFLVKWLQHDALELDVGSVGLGR
jgi:hypothetical protein